MNGWEVKDSREELERGREIKTFEREDRGKGVHAGKGWNGEERDRGKENRWEGIDRVGGGGQGKGNSNL